MVALAAAAAAGVCAAWTAHFFAAADEAVQQYACQTLLAAIEDDESLVDQAAALQDFVPAGQNPESLLNGLLQLEAALQQRQHDFGWLPQAAAAPEAAVEAVEDPSTGSQQAAVAESWLQRQQQRPATAGSRGMGLSVAAAEFRPAPAVSAVAIVADGMASLHLGGSSSRTEGDEQGASVAGSSAGSWQHNDDWQYDGDDVGATCEHAYHYLAVGPSEAAIEAALGAQDAADVRELLAGGPAAHEAFLAVLGDQFPLFSDLALRQLFEEQGGSLAATIHTLCSLETEIEGQAAAGVLHMAGGAAWLPEGTHGNPEAPSFTADDFPSLGGASASSSSRAAGGDSAAAYASRARAAAALPSQLARRYSRPRGAGAAATAAPAAPAPIWQQAEGVQRFATGTVLAAEYAAQRAEARDHARLRNAYFQKATQAYLAGDRRLAKELGAQGRWHGEQMLAAHQVAASELFARRNPGAACGAGGAGQTLDLHGLHVSEALQQLEALVPRMAAGGGKQLRVVVGRGTHGKVPARLPAAVRRWLQDQGLQFSEPYAGLLEIRL